ncbi:MAG: LysR family transcriptional regulator [Eggerthellaceae bacterium]|nr:LysR family transcriptional regulator [Eggerthellaceae bacterium]
MSVLPELKPFIRLTIANPASASHSEFGRGVAALCQGVADTGSLNAAAKQMGMAYSKAWRIMKDTEDALGFKMLNRDGAHGSTLTVEGQALLDTYYEVEKLAQEAADKLLAEAIAQ